MLALSAVLLIVPFTIWHFFFSSHLSLKNVTPEDFCNFLSPSHTHPFDKGRPLPSHTFFFFFHEKAPDHGCFKKKKKKNSNTHTHTCTRTCSISNQIKYNKLFCRYVPLQLLDSLRFWHLQAERRNCIWKSMVFSHYQRIEKKNCMHETNNRGFHLQRSWLYIYIYPTFLFHWIRHIYLFSYICIYYSVKHVWMDICWLFYIYIYIYI